MPIVNPSKSINIEIDIIIQNMFNLITSEQSERYASYVPALKRMTGSTNSAILLYRIIYWFRKKQYEPFYKFMQPCSHTLYKSGDSWEEELAFSPDEIRVALSNIGQKIHVGASKADAYENEDNYIIWWTDSNRVTWFDVQLLNFARRFNQYCIRNESESIRKYAERLSKILERTDDTIDATDDDPLGKPTMPIYLESGDSHLPSKLESPFTFITNQTSNQTTNPIGNASVPPRNSLLSGYTLFTTVPAVGKSERDENEKFEPTTELEKLCCAVSGSSRLTGAQINRLEKSLVYFEPQSNKRAESSLNALYELHAFQQWVAKDVLIWLERQKGKSGKIAVNKFIDSIEKVERFTTWANSNAKVVNQTAQREEVVTQNTSNSLFFSEHEEF